MKFKLLLLSLGLTYSFSSFSQETIFFSKIEIHPNVDLDSSHKFTREFIGKGQRISIHFINDDERPEHEINAFPEPPLTLRDNQANTSCCIIDGGI